MYCELSDLKNAITERVLLQLADDENAGTFSDNPPNDAYLRVIDAIDNADTVIDSHIGGRYDLPFSETPKIIKQISIQLSIVNLYERVRKEDLPESVSRSRSDQMKLLEKIQKGQVVLANQVKTEPEAEYLTNRTSADADFPDDLLSRF